jgi:hypothetical protein
MEVEEVEREEVVKAPSPPLTWDKDGLPGLLQDLQGSELSGPAGLLGAGVHHREPGDGLVLLVSPVFPPYLDQLTGRMRGEETPALVTLHEGVPGTRAQRVYVDPRPGASRAHHKPPGGHREGEREKEGRKLISTKQCS